MSSIEKWLAVGVSGAMLGCLVLAVLVSDLRTALRERVAVLPVSCVNAPWPTLTFRRGDDNRGAECFLLDDGRIRPVAQPVAAVPSPAPPALPVSEE